MPRTETTTDAEKSLDLLEERYRKRAFVPSIYAIQYLIGRFSLDIERLENSLCSKNQQAFTKYRSNAGKSCKKVLLTSKKYAPLRSTVFRLNGVYYWLINKQNKAVNFWLQAISESERVGAQPDIARTYMVWKSEKGRALRHAPIGTHY